MSVNLFSVRTYVGGLAKIYFEKVSYCNTLVTIYMKIWIIIHFLPYPASPHNFSSSCPNLLHVLLSPNSPKNFICRLDGLFDLQALLVNPKLGVGQLVGRVARNPVTGRHHPGTKL